MRPLRVVIVEDHEALRRLLRLRLELHGFDVVGEADDGPTGLAEVVTTRPDVVVADLRLPGIDGIGLVKAVRRRVPGARVVVFTGWPDPAERTRALAAGADAFVSKTTDLATLVRSVEDVGAACA